MLQILEWKKQIIQFSKKVVSYLYQQKFAKNIIIGKDNRISSDYVLSIINSILLSNGMAVNVIGVSTTPELVYLTKRFKFGLGIMITASHNPYEYNGIKCFDKNGLSVDLDNVPIKRIRNKEYKNQIDARQLKDTYIRDLKNRLNKNRVKCVFDCANGATNDVVSNIFAKYKIIGCDVGGRFINNCCGTEYIDKLSHICKKDKSIGFAFDGDGDRVIAVDSDGEVIDGDKILYILASQMLKSGDKVVGTKISGLGLELSLNRLGINLLRDKVGAKYVNSRIKKEGLILGGEPCGHIFILNNISDGVGVAIELLNILNRTGLTFKQLLKGFNESYTLADDININDVGRVVEYEQSSKNFRVVVRKSLTESKLRIYVDGIDKKLVETKFNQVKNGLLTM